MESDKDGRSYGIDGIRVVDLNGRWVELKMNEFLSSAR